MKFDDARAIAERQGLRPRLPVYREPGRWPDLDDDERRARELVAEAERELCAISRREVERLAYCHSWQWDAHRLLEEWLASGRLIRAADQRLRAAEADALAIAQAPDDGQETE